jgi:hypothetical protein
MKRSGWLLGLCSLGLPSIATSQTPEPRLPTLNGPQPASPAAADSPCRRLPLRYFLRQADTAGIVVRGRRVPCRITVEEGSYVVEFAGSRTWSTPLYFDCVAVDPVRIFNGRLHGQRVGIWLRWYPWGGLRRAVMYQEGRVERRMKFRPNGYFVVVMTTARGSLRRQQYQFYTREGYPIGGNTKFF